MIIPFFSHDTASTTTVKHIAKVLNFKTVLLLFFCFAVPVAGQNSGELIKRGRLFYKQGSNNPFTGKWIEGEDILKKRIAGNNDMFPVKIVKLETNYLDGLPHGESKAWYYNGRIAFQVKYENGQKTRLRNWTEDGYPEADVLLQNDKPVQLTRFWPGTGLMKSKNLYKNGELDGECKTWLKSGHLESKFMYGNGQLNGLSLVYYEWGQIASMEIYSHGILYKAYNRTEMDLYLLSN